MMAEPMIEERLADLEAWLKAHESIWKDRCSGAGVDSLVTYTRTLIAEVRRLRAENRRFRDVLNVRTVQKLKPIPS
jgi:hypothetical protein